MLNEKHNEGFQTCWIVFFLLQTDIFQSGSSKYSPSRCSSRRKSSGVATTKSPNKAGFAFVFKPVLNVSHLSPLQSSLHQSPWFTRHQDYIPPKIIIGVEIIPTCLQSGSAERSSVSSAGCPTEDWERQRGSAEEDTTNPRCWRHRGGREGGSEAAGGGSVPAGR